MNKKRTKLTEETVTLICTAIRNGSPRVDGCRAAGCSERTLKKWMSRGRKWIEQVGEWPRDEQVYVDLVNAVMQAHYDARSYMISKIRLAATPKDEPVIKETWEWSETREEMICVRRDVTTRTGCFEWTAAAWWLERRYPNEFALREHRKVTELKAEVAKLTEIVQAVEERTKETKTP